MNLPPKDHVGWICRTSAEEGRDEIKRLLADPAQTPESLRAILTAARETESTGAKRTSLLSAIAAAEKQLAKREASSLPSSVSLEVILPDQAREADLAAAAGRINGAIDLISRHEEAFEEATLESRLLVGREILKAKGLFGMTNAEAGKLGGRPAETVPPVTRLADGMGFLGWLVRECPRLKRATAEKYRTAFQGLGVSEDATPRQINDAVKTLRHKASKAGEPMPTLNSLYRSGRPEKAPLQIQAPPDSPQLLLEDAREAWFTWTEKGEKMVAAGELDNLDRPGLEKLRDFNLWLRDRLNARLKK